MSTCTVGLDRPEIHYATDRRVYNGALCRDMQRAADSVDSAWKALQKLEPAVKATYFPMPPAGWMVSIRHETDTRLWFDELTTVMHWDKGSAILEAWDVLMERRENNGKTKSER
jgi:hypothetical protein